MADLKNGTDLDNENVANLLGSGNAGSGTNEHWASGAADGGDQSTTSELTAAPRDAINSKGAAPDQSRGQYDVLPPRETHTR